MAQDFLLYCIIIWRKKRTWNHAKRYFDHKFPNTHIDFMVFGFIKDDRKMTKVYHQHIDLLLSLICIKCIQEHSKVAWYTLMYSLSDFPRQTNTFRSMWSQRNLQNEEFCLKISFLKSPKSLVNSDGKCLIPLMVYGRLQRIYTPKMNECKKCQMRSELSEWKIFFPV